MKPLDYIAPVLVAVLIMLVFWTLSSKDIETRRASGIPFIYDDRVFSCAERK